ncbi:hypothetical protein JNUCC0626_49830 (plasmid) [Lentzea sp. JNUCC 0626]|uniref:hypothetical protein n=1 Tax=Lentzea sp. JNUCC 0626 TaxID=3367513 RepID=UPI003748FE92
MSGIYFHTPTRPDPVVLNGAERAHIDGLVRDTFRTTLRQPHMASLRQVLRLNGAAPVEGLDLDKLRILNLVFDHEEELEAHDAAGAQTLSMTGLMANTTIAALPASQALIWLHYGCEEHGWVDGPDRAWLADRYQDALGAGLARPGLGWDAVIDLLRERDDKPVVTSFYNDFPDRQRVVKAGIWPEAAAVPADAETDLDAELAVEHAWDELGDARRWELGMRVLRAAPADAGELRWAPEVFAEQGIAHERHAEELVRSGARLRLVPAAQRV